MATFYALMGEWVTCENGHRIVQIARDIPFPSQDDVSLNYENWQVEPPGIGSKDARCPACGAVWFDFEEYRGHFSSGWRRYLDVQSTRAKVECAEECAA